MVFNSLVSNCRFAWAFSLASPFLEFSWQIRETSIVSKNIVRIAFETWFAEIIPWCASTRWAIEQSYQEPWDICGLCNGQVQIFMGCQTFLVHAFSQHQADIMCSSHTLGGTNAALRFWRRSSVFSCCCASFAAFTSCCFCSFFRKNSPLSSAKSTCDKNGRKTQDVKRI